MAQVIITNVPQNTTVVEGGNATFQCAGEENGMALLFGWRFTPSGSSVPVTLITGTNLTGIEMVTVSDGLRTMVTFSGVQREADGGAVVCLAVGSTGSVLSDPATLTVQCELGIKCGYFCGVVTVSVAMFTFSGPHLVLSDSPVTSHLYNAMMLIAQ